MQKPKRFDVGYSVGFLYAYLGLTIPHSVAVNLAYPTEIPVNGESGHADWGGVRASHLSRGHAALVTSSRRS
jgi:hypothetical protein